MKVFVVMSFDSEFDSLYNFIKNVFEDAGHTIFRTDDLLHQQNILKDIVTSIYESDLIIADLTGLNANVFYELGLSHALKKNVLLLTQDISELPFDLRSYRVIEYSTHFSQVVVLKEKLLKIISDLEKGIFLFSNPITDWLRQKIDNPVPNGTSISRIMRTDVSDNLPDDSDLGFLDFTADIEETLTELTEIVNGIGEKTQGIGTKATESTVNIQDALKNKSQGTASYVRKIARKTAESMNEYGKSIKISNEKYEELWTKLDNSIVRLLESNMRIDTKEDLDALTNYINIISGLKNTILSSRDGFVSMLKSIIGLRGIQKDITRASNLIEIEIKRFVGLLDKSEATIEKVTKIGNKKVKELQNHF